MNPIPSNLKSEAKKAAKILREFTEITSRNGPDVIIPAHVIAKAQGLAILSVIKAGFLVTARGGSGIVLARLPDGRWSAPSAIGIAGLGGGFEIGIEKLRGRCCPKKFSCDVHILQSTWVVCWNIIGGILLD